MNVITIIPPLVQLNAPYPSGAYLTSFFKKEGQDAQWADLSIELFYEIFSRSGLEKLFSLSEKTALSMADKAEKNGDDNTAFNIRRYISQKENWIEWIDFITAVLSGGGAREKEHQFLYSPFAPRGQRMENFLEQLAQDGREPSVDDVRFLCSYALADLADYITAVFDKEFSLIRYAEALTVDERTFAEVEKGLDSPILEHFYKPVLERWGTTVIAGLDPAIFSKTLICISIPFAGTFIPALYTARFLKSQYGQKVFICIGGGFVNTELRELRDASLGKYIDAISYDRGYGSYKALFDNTVVESVETAAESMIANPLYKLRLFQNGKVIEPVWQDEKLEKYETEITAQIIPDYSDIDFSRYLRMCDDKNAMHRIWTDGSWIKAYLAHGCYWHRCAFCDTQLDYVCAYRPVEVRNLYEGLLKTAREKNVYGIHFVDEAMPPVALKKFALENARHGNPLYFWGNIRFEKTFTKDLAAFLSYCGLGGVSAGLEVAAESGLENINKGTDISSIVSACAALKEAGVLVHAYMIFGFWYDTAQTIIDSMETLRQFYSAGLLDSCFWHKFVLTKNSTVYTEWKEGKQKKLQPVEPKSDKKGGLFAGNNIHFKDENQYDKFQLPLENSLNCWMHGDGLEKKVQKWFDFPVPPPTVGRDFIEKKIEEYEEKNRKRGAGLNEKTAQNLWWLGGTPVLCGLSNSSASEYRWLYLMEEQTAPSKFIDVDILLALRPEVTEDVRVAALNKITASPSVISNLKKLLGRGLVLLDF
ncbi:radical SAM protein [Treponema bryantii]|uniref:radical SAM protein n=1 Tax=Treponema bryantii TaxID=163 RepID=UPI002B2C7855|nr:radical SAM protein [Treponema bryantii]